MGRKNKKRSRGIDITHTLTFKSNLNSNQYVRDHVIVERCSGHAVLTINGDKKFTTGAIESGTRTKFPRSWTGANWTGLLADKPNGKRYWDDFSNEDTKRLTTCVEGKLLFELMESKNLFHEFTQENDIEISIFISYDKPCHTCQPALQYWVNSWKDLCRSLTVKVVGRNKPYVYN